MMSKKSPQLRFEGFTDDWEERKLGDVISISSEKNGNQFSRADVLSVSREAGVVNQIEYQGRSFAGASIANYRVVHKGDLIYTKSPLKGAPNGIFKTSEAEGIVSPLYAVYQSREANAAFVGWLLSNDNFATHYLYPLVNKGSKNTLLVSDADAISGHLSFPNIEEQAKIVSFFTQLDNLIALHQRKLDLLKEQKKGYLQKMFPKNGEKVPELRFAGFADDWEERKLGEVIDIENGYAFKSEYFSDEEKRHIVLTPGSVKIGGGFQKDKGRYYDVSGVFPEKFIFKPGNIFITMTDLTPTAQSLGYPAIVPRDDNVYLHNQRLGKIINTTTNPEFLYTLLTTDTYHKEIVSSASGTTVKHSSVSKILDFKSAIPNIDEQKLIGSFFKELDNTIALHQRKLDLLKEQKKGFLQKMFV